MDGGVVGTRDGENYEEAGAVAQTKSRKLNWDSVNSDGYEREDEGNSM